MSSSPRILIVGGTGETGRLMAADLLRHQPQTRITLASRRGGTAGLHDPRLNAITLDVEQPGSTLSALRAFDWAVLALGPASHYAARVHALCVNAGLPCLDINDSLPAAQHIAALQRSAQAMGVPIISGCGLLPGLSSLLLRQLVDSAPASSAHRYRCQLYLGARNASGPAGPWSLLENLREPALRRHAGALQPWAAAWSGTAAWADLPGLPALSLQPFSTPEAALIGPDSALAAVHTLECRYAIEYFGAGVARAIAASGLLRQPWIEAASAGLMYRSGQRMLRQGRGSGLSLLSVQRFDDAACVLKSAERLVAGDISSAYLTASVAAATLGLVLQGQWRPRAGVQGLHEVPEPQVLERALARRGILVTQASATRSALIWGQMALSSAVAGTPDAPQLRHQGRYWYSQRPPAWMKKAQQKILCQSALWRRVCEVHGPMARVLRMSRLPKLNWQLRRQARAALAAQGLALPPSAQADFSLFAAGFALLSESLGAAALPLYRDMFLRSAAMEMAWFWPDAQVFAALSRPQQALQDYWLQYLDASAQGGVLQYRLERQTAQQLAVHITQCVYGRWLEACGQDDLRPLVREMEVAALRLRADALGWDCQADIRPDGTASIVLHQRSHCLEEARDDAIAA